MERRSVIAAVALAALAAMPIAADDASRSELVIGMGSYGLELNPYKAIYAHEMQLFTGIYEGLFSYDPHTLEPVRALAESYEKSDDGTAWTFTLREGARWQDGSPVTADDFVQSWRYLLAPELRAEYAVFLDVVKGARDFRTGKNPDPASVAVRAMDERTLVVELEAPAAYFTRLLCHTAFVPAHRSLRGVRSWDSRAVVGNGPYRIRSFGDQELVLELSETYWDRDNVAIPRIRILFLDDAESATALYNDGEIDWLTDMVDEEKLLDPEAVQYSPMFGTGYFFWNCARAPWSDARVRKALALALPWETLRSKEDFYAPTEVLILPFSGYRSPEGLSTTNTKEARKLLSAAGFPAGTGLPVLRIVVPDSEWLLKTVSAIEEAWKQLGIRVEVVKVDSGASARDVRQSGYALTFTSWIGDFADPISFLLMWTSDSGLNEAGYKSTEFDKLIRRSMGQEGRVRLTTLSEAEGILLQDAAVMPLYHSLSFNVIDTQGVTGWFVNPMDIHPYKNLGFGYPSARPDVAILTPEVLP